MKGSDKPSYPALRDEADQASARAQALFMRLNAAQLIILVAVAFTAGLSSGQVRYQREIAGASFVLLLGALAVTTVLRVRKPDDRWFRCRAYAENFKGAVWRYVMASPDASIGSAKIYVDQIAQLGERMLDLQYEFVRLGKPGHFITPWMNEVSSLPLEEKLIMYKRMRIEDQIQWYSSKASLNARAERTAFVCMFAAEFLAVALSAVQVWKLLPINLTGVIATLGTAAIAWAQLKRFSDLETSYAIAAIDLRRLADAHNLVTNQAEADVFVAEVEAAVSREHSMWLAKRIPAAQ